MPTNLLAGLTHLTWADHVGTRFSLHHGEHAVEELKLIDVTKLGAGRPAATGKRDPYSLIFRATTREFFLPQRTYPLNHPVMGELEIFLVPVGPDEHGMRFEAIFS